ncbi:MAG: S9 family peptidase [Acidobacteria bacterium]|nr:MAG: S9 family peptidase [Acidobacteriota bacterium]
MTTKSFYRLVVAGAACLIPLGVSAGLVAPSPAQERPPAKPPVAPIREVVDNYFGTEVTDPYRYMENLEDPEVQAWLKAQNDYSHSILGRIPGHAQLLARVKELDESAPSRVWGVRRLPSGRLFYLKALSQEPIFKLYMRDGLAGPEKLLLDPEKIAAGNPPYAIDYYTPSNDGRYVAYGVSPGGSEAAVMHILDTIKTRDTGELIDGAEFGEPIGWLPDGRSFLYNRLQKPARNAPPDEKYLKSKVYLHLVGTDPERDASVFGFGVSPLVKVEPPDIPLVATAPESRYAVGILQHGVQNEVTLYVAPIDSLGKPGTPWHKVCGGEDGVTIAALHGDDLYLLTHKNASRFKVIRTPASNPEVAHAEVILPPGEAVLTDLRAAQDALYVQVRDGAIGGIQRIPYETPVKAGRIALPIDGSVWLLPADPRVPGVVFSLTGWNRASHLFAYDPKRKFVSDTELQPVGPFDAPQNVKSVETKVRSADGTMVPLSIIYPRGLRFDGSNPTRLYAYGAYGISIDPFFDPKSLAWLEQGGVVAIAHVRGGGEFGEDWHKDGQKLTKPNSWRDFIACAEYLVERRYTSPAHLAAEGRSAGGALVGRVITERPDLFGAAISEVGDTDSLRTEFMETGPANIPEFGTVKERDGFRALYEMSAYGHVKEGTRYPAVMLLTGIHDHNVAVWQPAKMAARLLAESTSGKPVLLRIDYAAGHGMGSTKTQRQEQLADEWAFLFWQLGVPAFQPARGRRGP